MAEDKWYYVENGEPVGPVDASTLKRRVAEGDLQPNDLVWRKGLAEWVPASKVKGLFRGPAEAWAASPDTPPLPAPPVSKRWQRNVTPQERFIRRALVIIGMLLLGLLFITLLVKL